MTNKKLYTNSAEMTPATINLKIAYDVAESMNINISGQFLLGAIAPDAVFVRTNLTQKDIDDAHYRQQSIKKSWTEAAHEFKLTESPFMKGYSLHIMTDVLWLSGVYAKLKEKYGDSLSKNVVVDDLNYIEKWLFRQKEYQSLWNGIAGSKINNLHFYVAPGEVELFKSQKSQSIKYDIASDTMNYLTFEDVDNFIKRSVKRILLTLNG